MDSQNTERFLLPAGNRKMQRLLALVGFLLLCFVAMKIDHLLWELFSPTGAPELLIDPKTGVLGILKNTLTDFLDIFITVAIGVVLIRILLRLKALWDQKTAWKRLPESPETRKP